MNQEKVCDFFEKPKNSRYTDKKKKNNLFNISDNFLIERREPYKKPKNKISVKNRFWEED